MKLHIRIIPFIAWHFCLAAIILALIVLLAGANGGESVAIITFNTSALGLTEYNHPNSTLHDVITALVPTIPANPSSITQYLGIRDWYSIHYLSVCSGFYTQSSYNPIDVHCTRHMSGYTFSLPDTLRDELLPSVKSLADEITPGTYNTAPWIALLYIGLILAIFDLLLLPWTWFGTKRLNGYCLGLAVISYLTFQISGSLATGRILNAHSNAFNITSPANPSAPIHSISPYPSTFLALTWVTVVCMIVTVALVAVEWRFELWTLKGERIEIYRKPPLKSWSLMDAVAYRKPVSTDAEYGGEDGIELR